MKRFWRASDHEEPLKIAIVIAGSAAGEDSKETKSALGDHAECCKGKLNAIPGYDNTYVPIVVP